MGNIFDTVLVAQGSEFFSSCPAISEPRCYNCAFSSFDGCGHPELVDLCVSSNIYFQKFKI